MNGKMNKRFFSLWSSTSRVLVRLARKILKWKINFLFILLLYTVFMLAWIEKSYECTTVVVVIKIPPKRSNGFYFYFKVFPQHMHMYVGALSLCLSFTEYLIFHSMNLLGMMRLFYLLRKE
jgi:hypothetical protein